MAADLGSLLSKLLAVREPLLLSEFDAIEIARQLPVVAAMGPKACFGAGGPLSLADILVDVQSRCPQRSDSKDDVLIAIDPSTGAARDRDEKPIQSLAAERVAHELLAKLTQERATVRESLNAICLAQ